jgi:hypothetical protein
MAPFYTFTGRKESSAQSCNGVMERKIFWISLGVLSLVAEVILPMWWALAATIPIVFASWWIAYRSDWF